MNAIATQDQANIMEQVLLGGDLSKLNPAQRVSYYTRVCESVGLNPLTRPFDYITLKGRLTLYAKKDATDQLRSKHNVSISDVNVDETETHFIVKVKGQDGNGRTDVEVGVVSKKDMQGDFGNAYMKAVTKAKRRLTLSLCGLGWLDETEIETIPDAHPVLVADDGQVAVEDENQDTGRPEAAVEIVETLGDWAVSLAARHWNIAKKDAAQQIAKAKLGRMDKAEYMAWLNSR